MDFVTIAEISREVTVFDMQGRYLGNLQVEQLHSGNLAEMVKARFKKPGAYLVRFGNAYQKVLRLPVR